MTGKGMRAEFGEQKIANGNARLFDGEVILDAVQQPCSAGRDSAWQLLIHEGSTVVVVINALRLLGYGANGEEPRYPGNALSEKIHN